MNNHHSELAQWNISTWHVADLDAGMHVAQSYLERPQHVEIWPVQNHWLVIVRTPVMLD